MGMMGKSLEGSLPSQLGTSDAAYGDRAMPLIFTIVFSDEYIGIDEMILRLDDPRKILLFMEKSMK